MSPQREQSSHTKYSLTALTFLAVLFVSACGVGSNQEEPEPITSPAQEEVALSWGEYGPFDESAELARTNYTGLTQKAILTMESASAFVDTIVFDPFADLQNNDFDDRDQIRFSTISRFLSLPYFQLDGFVDAIPSIDTFDCVDGGDVSMSIVLPAKNVAESYIVEAEYNQCNNGSIVVNGNVKLAWPGNLKTRTEQFVSFDALSIEYAERKLEATGVVTWASLSSCSDQHERTATMLVRDLNNDQSILLDRFTRGSEAIDDDSCYDSYPRANVFDGTVLHSDYGTVQVQTPEYLRYVSGIYSDLFDLKTFWNEAFDAERDETGWIEITGESGSSAEFTYTLGMLASLASDYTEPLATLSVWSTVDSEPEVLHVDSASFIRGVMSDLGDNDNDGLPNSWELFHQLNPDSPADALMDSDDDGWSNIQEFQWLGHPTDSRAFNYSLDAGITVDVIQPYMEGAATQNIFAIVTLLYAQRDMFNPYNFHELVLSGDASWDISRLPQHCMISEGDSTRLRCEHDEYLSTVTLEPAYILPSSDATVSVTAEIPVAFLERDESNNSSTSKSDYPRVYTVDQQVDAEPHLIGNTDKLRKTTATISQPFEGPPVPLDLVVSVPTGITVVSAELYSTIEQSLLSRCTVIGNIDCRLENMAYTDTVTVEIDYIVNVQGSWDLIWSIGPVSLEENTENNEFVTIVEYVQSTAELQLLVDSAVDGESVVLPAGLYTGTIDGGDKKVVISGATGTESTVLMSVQPDEALITRLGKRSTLANLEFRTVGGPVVSHFNENLTIRDSLFLPVEGRHHAISSLLEATESTSYRLLNNRIIGWGVGKGNSCESLFNSGNWHAYHTFVYLQHNLFLRNQCEQLVLAKHSSFHLPAKYYITNNTFVGNPSLFAFEGTDRNSEAHFMNNIIQDATSILSMDTTLFELDKPGIVSSRNLIWNSERASFLTTDLVSKVGVRIENTDFNVDPLFVDPSSDDYRLAGNSPAIDAGTTPTPYIWSWSDYRDEFLAPDPAESISPLDGLQNGSAVFDIGAYEFDPL